MRLSDLYNMYLEDIEQMLQDQDSSIGIEESKIPLEQRKQPETYLHWGRLHAMAQNEHDYQEEFIKTVVWPRAKNRARDQLELTGHKATVDAMDELAKQDDEYRRESLRRLKIKSLVRYLSTMEEALNMRGNLLQSVGAYQREELKSIPRDLDSLKNNARDAVYRSRNS